MVERFKKWAGARQRPIRLRPTKTEAERDAERQRRAQRRWEKELERLGITQEEFDAGCEEFARKFPDAK